MLLRSRRGGSLVLPREVRVYETFPATSRASWLGSSVRRKEYIVCTRRGVDSMEAASRVPSTLQPTSTSGTSPCLSLPPARPPAHPPTHPHLRTRTRTTHGSSSPIPGGQGPAARREEGVPPRRGRGEVLPAEPGELPRCVGEGERVAALLLPAVATFFSSFSRLPWLLRAVVLCIVLPVGEEPRHTRVVTAVRAYLGGRVIAGGPKRFWPTTRQCSDRGVRMTSSRFFRGECQHARVACPGFMAVTG